MVVVVGGCLLSVAVAVVGTKSIAPTTATADAQCRTDDGRRVATAWLLVLRIVRILLRMLLLLLLVVMVEQCQLLLQRAASQHLLVHHLFLRILLVQLFGVVSMGRRCGRIVSEHILQSGHLVRQAHQLLA